LPKRFVRDTAKPILDTLAVVPLASPRISGASRVRRQVTYTRGGRASRSTPGYYLEPFQGSQHAPAAFPKLDARLFTPAMEANIADHVWSLEEIVNLLA
jgi:hypothetical protein